MLRHKSGSSAATAVNAGMAPKQPSARQWCTGLYPAALAFTLGALGILDCRQLPGPVLLAGLSIPALLPWRGRSVWAAAIFGALLTVQQGNRLLDQRWPASRNGEDVWVRGAVTSLPERRGDGDDAGWQFVFEPERVEAGGELPPRIRVGWYRSADPPPRDGDCWRLLLRMRAPHGTFNPGGFDTEKTLLRQHIGATASVRTAQSCGVAPGHRLDRLRQQLADQVRSWLPGSDGGLVLALTLGDTSGLTDADWTAFRRTGTTHLVAISGFNIAIVAGLVFVLVRWGWTVWPWLCLRLPAQKAGLIAASLAAIGYAILTGFDPPVARAALTTTLAAVAVISGLSSSAARVLTWAWLALVASDPVILLGPGTWLSFGAVASIFYISAGRPGQAHTPAWAWREGLRLQLMLSLLLAPATVFYFQGTSWLGPPVNLLAVPVTAVLTPLLIGLLVLAAILPPWGQVPLRLAAQVTAAGRDGLAWLGTHVPDAWLPLNPAPGALLLASFGVVLLIAPRGVPLRGLGLLCLLPLLWPPQLAPASGFELTALDVGQGLAVVIRTADHALLFDTGPASPDGYSAGESIVAPYLLAVGIHRLDLLVVSHADIDHRGGVPAVRERLEIGDERGALAGQRPCRAGENWRWDGVDFRFIHPDGADWGDNNGSCVLRISAGDHAALLPGDIELPAETHLLALGDGLRADVLLAPHHGSRSSSSAGFVDAVAPRVVIFPAGWQNRFHHPAPEVVDRYRREGAATWITGTEGAVDIRIRADGDPAAASGWRASHAHWWNVRPPPRREAVVLGNQADAAPDRDR